MPPTGGSLLMFDSPSSRVRLRLAIVSAVVVGLIALWFAASALFRRLNVQGNYQAAIAYGAARDPLVQEFSSAFPSASHSISYYTGQFGAPQWNSEVVLNDQIQVTMTFPIALSKGGREFTRTSSPTFVALKFKSTTTTTGQVVRDTIAGGIPFGLAKWRRFVTGELSLDRLASDD